MLQVKQLSRAFGGLTAVSHVSVVVDAASIHTIIGPNGAGKTTLFNLITGALAPDAGSVRFQDANGWPPERLVKAGLVRTFQRTSVFRQLATIENVALAIRARSGVGTSLWQPARREQRVLDEAAEVLAVVGLQGREHTPAGQLAHGAQRALDVAIGLALSPTCILMDEPLAGMSRGDREVTAALILKLRDEFGLTVVLVEHDVGMVLRLSDRITVMSQGQVIACGTPAEIRADEAVRQAYLKGEFAQ